MCYLSFSLCTGRKDVMYLTDFSLMLTGLSTTGTGCGSLHLLSSIRWRLLYFRAKVWWTAKSILMNCKCSVLWKSPLIIFNILLHIGYQQYRNWYLFGWLQYHRIYSPITFGKKYDPDGLYVKHFLPVLKGESHEYNNLFEFKRRCFGLLRVSLHNPCNFCLHRYAKAVHLWAMDGTTCSAKESKLYNWRWLSSSK